VNPARLRAVATGMETLLSDEGLKLWATVEDHHESARAHLVAPTGPTFAGVAWLSAHLAATEHTLHHALPAGPVARAAAAADQQLVGQLKRRLRVLERQLSGDSTVHVATNPAGSALLDALDAHARTELAIIRIFDRSLDQDQMRALSSRYRDAVQHGATRPHPHGRHSGALEPVVFALNHATDHIMDTLDARPNPLPHPPKRARRAGKWGLYVLGTGSTRTEHPETDEDSSAGSSA
jgi:hypothetical protein